MSKVAITGNGAGTATYTIAAPGTNTDRTITLPDQTGTLVMTDAAGNLGVGVTPGSWDSGFSMIQTGANGSSFGGRSAANTAYVMSNAIRSGSEWRYIGTAAAAQYQIESGNFYWFTAPSGTAGNAISFTQAMTLDASGNLLVGATSGVFHRLQKDNNNDYAAAVLNTNVSSPYGLAVALSGASPNNATNKILQCEDSTTTRLAVRSNGGIANFSGNNVNLSDRREKKDIAPAKDYLATICAIPVVTFNYNDQPDSDPGTTLGVIAQDVEAVAPEFVMESDWGTEDDPKVRKSIYQTDLTFAMMKAIQEQQALIQTLTARVAALEGASDSKEAA